LADYYVLIEEIIFARFHHGIADYCRVNSSRFAASLRMVESGRAMEQAKRKFNISGQLLRCSEKEKASNKP
jgi:hypothetical protein